MIQEMNLERFKKFEDVKITFTPFTVLMGENSSGKTTILQALNLALLSINNYEMVFKDNQDKIKVRPKGVGLSDLPGIDLSDFRELYYAKISRSARGTGKVGLNITLKDINDNKYKLQITSQFGSFNVKCISTTTDLKNVPSVQNYSPLFISGFVGLTPTEERIFPVTLTDRLKSGHVSSIIRNLVFDTKENTPEKFSKLKSRLARDFDFHLDEILFDEKKDLYVQAQYSELCDEKRLALDFSSSGSGFMQVLQILAPIYRFCPDKSNIVLLDEPDAHLHPNLQTSLANSLKSIQQELDIQIIISTHSTSIIRATEPKNVIPVSCNKKHCKPLMTKNDIEDNIRSKIDSYNLAKSVLSGKMVFFEDENLDIWEKIDEVSNRRVFKGANTSPILKGRGKTDRVPFQIKPIMKELLDADIDVYFIRDSDGLPDEFITKLKGFSESKNINLILTEYFEMESYLLNSSFIRNALQKKYEEDAIPSIEDIHKEIINALKSTISLSKYRYDETLGEEINQLAILMNWDEYRNPQRIKSYVKEWHNNLEKLDEYDNLLRFGMGKEALKIILGWINNDLKMQLSKRDIINEISDEKYCMEIATVLDKMKSKELKDSPYDHEVYNEEDFTDEIEKEVENYLFDLDSL